MNDFYVGYLPKAPTELARFTRRVVIGLALVTVAIALLLLRGQNPFPPSAFEFGKARSFEGVIQAQPYAVLLVARPGQTAAEDRYSEYLLVAPGKHGAGDLVSGWVGKSVRLGGQLIYRDGVTMIEIEPGSITLRESETPPALPTRSVDVVTMTGEIVDSKCYLGVMNPGSGKVHRDCASRCLSGGIPPIFIAIATHKQFLLVGTDGKALNRDALREFVAEPLIIQGEVFERGDQHLLTVDPQLLKHQPDGLTASRHPIQPRR
ncbi:MAG: hypothetical protein HY010_16700 [Acidobacteria bacterium]|nr:hypothetical protein [Acidobacteriota bacterium]